MNEKENKLTIENGIQECSKCRYYLRCDECVYNKKGIENIVNETRKETAEKILKLVDEIEKNNPNGWIGALHLKYAIAKQFSVEVEV